MEETFKISNVNAYIIKCGLYFMTPKSDALYESECKKNKVIYDLAKKLCIHKLWWEKLNNKFYVERTIEKSNYYGKYKGEK